MTEPDPLPPRPAPSARLELRAGLLLLLLVVLVGGTALYLMYARGTFESTQRLVLVAEDSDGVRVGMDLTFAGFPIGRVRRIELADDGNARILVDVPRRDARWLRESSVFTLVRNLVGGASLRAYSGVLTDAPLADGAERKVLIGDTAAELPRLVAAARELVQNLVQLSAPESALATSLGNLQALTERARGPHGAAGLLLGNEADARQVGVLLQRVNALLGRVDGIAARADAQLLGSGGVVPETRTTIRQVQAMLGDARETLKKVDAVLAEAQGVASNARVATTDLGALRGEVDATVRRVEQLVEEVNRKWPFARDSELKLR